MGSDADFDEDERAMIATYRLVSEDAADQVRTILMAKRLGEQRWEVMKTTRG